MRVQDVIAGLCYAAYIFLKVGRSPVYLRTKSFDKLEQCMVYLDVKLSPTHTSSHSLRPKYSTFKTWLVAVQLEKWRLMILSHKN